MNDRTPKQKAAIDAAFSLLDYYLSNSTMEGRWDFAWRYERKGRPRTAAKALAVENFLDGFDNPNQPISTLGMSSPGYALITLYGARIERERIPAEAIEKMRAGVRAHQEAQAARFARL